MPGSAAPDWLQATVLAQQSDEFARIAAVINDPATPFTGLRVIISSQEAVPYFQSLLDKYGINGSIVVK